MFIDCCMCTIFNNVHLCIWPRALATAFSVSAPIHMNDSFSFVYLILNCLIIFQVKKYFHRCIFFKWQAYELPVNTILAIQNTHKNLNKSYIWWDVMVSYIKLPYFPQNLHILKNVKKVSCVENFHNSKFGGL